MIKHTNTFKIYRDGQIDKGYQIKQLSRTLLANIGYIGYKALEATVDGLDEWIGSTR